ncbi:MAG: HigA family addiction module antidote protein [Flavobacteriales bacterium]|nr:HigA family addiction module antidote protein [Flavobacteriales bacterium]
MLPPLYKIKGLHPGIILKRELQLRGLKANELADMVDEHKQTISAIINGRRAITPKLSIKIARHLEVDEDYFMILQACYDVKTKSQEELKRTPNLSLIRKILFWDTSIDSIDWEKNSKSVLKRILERGNPKEIKEIISFYGKKRVIREVKQISKSILPSFEENIKKFNLA